MSILTSLIQPVANIAGSIIKNRGELAQAKHSQKMKVLESTSDWESKMADATTNSYKDEFWCLILASPLIAIFYGVFVDNPEIIERVRHGFNVLNELDEWYTYLLFLAISASCGLRSADKIFALRKKK